MIVIPYLALNFAISQQTPDFYLKYEYCSRDFKMMLALEHTCSIIQSPYRALGHILRQPSEIVYPMFSVKLMNTYEKIQTMDRISRKTSRFVLLCIV